MQKSSLPAFAGSSRLTPLATGLFRMWRSGNIRRARALPRGIRAGLIALGVSLALTIAGPARAQPDAPGPAQHAPAPPVSELHARTAHQLVELWAASGEVAGDEALPMPVEDLVGVRVTLRRDGITYGAGEAVRSDFEGSADLVPLLQQAAREAFARVAKRLGDAHRQALESGTDPAEVPQVEPADVLATLQVDVQVGHGLEQVYLPGNRSAAAVFGSFAPDYHGLLMPGDAGPAVVWPATALARNIQPRSQLTQLLGDQGYAHNALARIGRRDGPALHRFHVLHVVRPEPAMPTMQLVRGQVILPPRPIGAATIGEIASRLADHLERRFVADGQVRGTYHPTSDQFDPDIASDEDAALACYALIQRSRYLASQGRPKAASALAERVLDTLLPLARRQVEAGPEMNAGAGALALMSLVDHPQAGRYQDLRQELTLRLFALRHSQGGFRTSSAEVAEPVTQATQALILAALASRWDQTRDDNLAELLVEEQKRLWDGLVQRPDVAALPWALLAQRRSGGLEGENSFAAEIAVVTQGLAEQQVTATPEMGPADVVGGFQLGQSLPDGPPNPDWRTAPVLALVAGSLRESAVREGEDVLGWLMTAGRAARFLGQLMMDEPGCYYVRTSADSVGGLRLALYDNRLAVAPQAMGLLAMTEMQQALDELESESIQP